MITVRNSFDDEILSDLQLVRISAPKTETNHSIFEHIELPAKLLDYFKAYEVIRATSIK